MHGGLATRMRLNPRRPDAKKPGPKPRDPAIAMRRKLHARLLRTDPTMVAAVAPFAAPATAVGASPVKDAPAPHVRPPWPPNGYRGSDDARRLEAHERRFVRKLVAADDLEAQLARAAGYQPLRLSHRELDAVLTSFVATMRTTVEAQFATFAAAEHELRRDGDDAIQVRLARLRFEIDAYIGGLTTAKTLLVLRAEQREQEEQRRAKEMSRQVMTAGLASGARRRGGPVEREPRPLSIAPWQGRS